MSLSRKIRNHITKLILGKNTVPRGLYELHEYFRLYEPITFKKEIGEHGEIIAISNNFRYGSIITSAKTEKELDQNIKDAILTQFEIPSSYSKEASVQNLGKKKQYAFA